MIHHEGEINRIDEQKIIKLEDVLSKVRIKPQTRRDLLICKNVSDLYVSLCHSENEGKYWSSSASYGSSSKKIDSYTSSKIFKKTGDNFGQDYVYSTRNYICLADGHGKYGERISCFAGIYLPSYIDKMHINRLLCIGTSESFGNIFIHITNAFKKIKSKLEIYYDINSTKCEDFTNIEELLSCNKLNPKSGSTLNYASIHCVCNKENQKRRFIISANIGDSETYSVWRYPCGKVRVKIHSGLHSVENIHEAKRIVSKYKDNIQSVLPIYSRFHTYNNDILQAEFPSEVVHHIDSIPNKRPYPIYDIDNQGKLNVNLETLHKVNMAIGKYGDLFDIDQWYGGFQSLRTNVIEKKVNGKWKGVCPVPNGIPENFGSTPAGLCQNTRGFGDIHNKHIDIIPHTNITEIPEDVHVTLICQSDGYGDTVYLSEVADVINQLPRNNINQATLIKNKLIRLMHNKIIGQDKRGYTLDDNLRPTWDDVSFALIDSPPIISEQ